MCSGEKTPTFFLLWKSFFSLPPCQCSIKMHSLWGVMSNELWMAFLHLDIYCITSMKCERFMAAWVNGSPCLFTEELSFLQKGRRGQGWKKRDRGMEQEMELTIPASPRSSSCFSWSECCVVMKSTGKNETQNSCYIKFPGPYERMAKGE